MRARLRDLNDESGFTLPELITAMAVGMIVLLAAFFLLEKAVSTSGKLTDRQDAAQRGRLAMESVSRELRSQVCLGDAGEPITQGTNDSVTFYANLSDVSDSADRRTLRFVPGATPKDNKLVEDVYYASGTFPDLTFPPMGSPNETRELLRAVVPVQDGGVDRPIFRYYEYRVGGTPGELSQLTTPLSTSDAESVVMVKAAFQSLPMRKGAISPSTRYDGTSFESDIYVRLADPTKPAEGPRCL
jgi:prepilin-type N-terminal cleavage/methylation domain-containing protein